VHHIEVPCLARAGDGLHESHLVYLAGVLERDHVVANRPGFCKAPGFLQARSLLPQRQNLRFEGDGIVIDREIARLDRRGVGGWLRYVRKDFDIVGEFLLSVRACHEFKLDGIAVMHGFGGREFQR
jgi:hypothetical protein